MRGRFLRLSVWLLPLLWACAKPPPPVSLLGAEPDWSRLEVYQETLTRKAFENRLSRFDDPAVLEKYFQFDEGGVTIQATAEKTFRLRFAAEPAAKAKPPPWQAGPLHPGGGRPLAGLRIALDPGHLGGEWARMERRWFRPPGGDPIAEGDLALAVAKKLRQKLQALGAEVFLLREDATPVTPLRPADLRPAAEQALDAGQDLNLEAPESFQQLPREVQVQRVSELLFYRVAELRARAAKVNEQIRPDLTVCLHFNAYDWGDPEHPREAAGNHLHVLVPGAAEAGEWALDDIRFELVERILSDSGKVELPLAESIANSLAETTGLPPAAVPGGTVKKIGDNPYLWARNLLATRLDRGPVVFIEAYVMNYPEVIARLEAGDFEGRKNLGGKKFTSLYEDYAEGVARGILAYYGRPAPPESKQN